MYLRVIICDRSIIVVMYRVLSLYSSVESSLDLYRLIHIHVYAEADTDFDVRKFTDHTLYASEGMLKDYTGEGLDPVPLLYQTGYLTIADFDRAGREYTLAFPNEEVKYGFMECLLPEYVADCGAGSGNDIFTLRRYIERGELDA